MKYFLLYLVIYPIMLVIYVAYHLGHLVWDLSWDIDLLPIKAFKLTLKEVALDIITPSPAL